MPSNDQATKHRASYLQAAQEPSTRLDTGCVPRPETLASVKAGSTPAGCTQEPAGTGQVVEDGMTWCLKQLEAANAEIERLTGTIKDLKKASQAKDDAFAMIVKMIPKLLSGGNPWEPPAHLPMEFMGTWHKLEDFVKEHDQLRQQVTEAERKLGESLTALSIMQSERDAAEKHVANEQRLSDSEMMSLLRRRAKHADALEQQVAELTERLAAAEKFKAWVHSFLDGKGVPHDPDPEGNQKHGCRISGRMRWVFDLLAAAEKSKGEAEGNAEQLASTMQAMQRFYRLERSRLWDELQRIAPWADSNDMDWLDEIMCGLAGVESIIATEKAAREAAESRAAEAEKTILRYVAVMNAEYDGAACARHGGKIDDCPYGPMKADGFRDSTLMGMWQRGFDRIANKARAEAAEAEAAKLHTDLEALRGQVGGDLLLCARECIALIHRVWSRNETMDLEGEIQKIIKHRLRLPDTLPASDPGPQAPASVGQDEREGGE